MNFQQLIEVALKLIRQEQAKKPDGSCFAFYMDHGSMVDIKYETDPQSSFVASDFVYKDRLLGFPIFPVLTRSKGEIQVPTLTIVNLASDICYTP